MFDLEDHLRNIDHYQTKQQLDQKKHEKYLDELTYNAFYLNSSGKEWLSYQMAALMVPATEAQLQNPVLHLSLQQTTKRIIESISRQLALIEGGNHGSNS